MDRGCMIETFENKGIGANIRVIDRDGEPWFVAKDVCDALGLENSRQAVSRLDDDERDTVILNDGTSGNPEKTIISESGLYNLVIRSDKPNAKEFRRWITHDVLPSIRKHGAYMTPKTIDDMMADPRAFAELFKRAADERDRRLLAEDKIRYLTPKVPFGTISESNGRPRESLVKPYYRAGWSPVRTITTVTEWQRTLFDLD